MRSKPSIVFNHLPQVMSVLNLLSSGVYARICMECGWDDDTYLYYFANSDRISSACRKKINTIVAEQARNLAAHPPQLHPNVHDDECSA